MYGCRCGSSLSGSVGIRARSKRRGGDLKFSRMDTIVALDEGIPQIVDAKLLQALQRSIIKVKVVRVPVKGSLAQA